MSKLCREIDIAYAALKAGEPGLVRLSRAFRALARDILKRRFRLHESTRSLEYEIANKAVLQIDRFRGSSRISTWFSQIAKNAANNAVRQRINREGQATLVRGRTHAPAHGCRTSK